MNTEQLRSLKRLLDYVTGGEQEHFEACSPAEREGHIYSDILILQDYLTQQQGDFNS